VAVLVGTAIVFSALFLLSPDALSQKFLNTVPVLKADTESSPGADQAVEAAAPGPQTEPIRHDFRLSSDDSFYSVLSLFDVPGNEIYKMAKLAKPLYNLGRLRQGTVLRVFTVQNELDRVEYKTNEFDVLVIRKDASEEGGYSVEISELPWEVRPAYAAGTIKNSLYEAGIKAGADPTAVVGFSDIFAWDVDFASDIRKGDTFSIVYEVVYVEGRPLKTGRILAAEMTNQGKRYAAIYFEDSEGGTGYYDSEGKSLRRTLLRSPLRYRRISSYFSRKRFHPILKRYRPHHGIDYAAPVGTPVEAAGSGRVTSAGWKRGYGKFIVVKHKNSYSTAYGHLSRIRKGIKRGATVEQGDVIGYVGSTGISTGPHLHYEVRRGKRLINPLRIKPERNKTVPEADRARFEEVKAEMLKKLAGSDTVVASLPEKSAEEGGSQKDG
jgi:murein DD-endopeptidase MepM/ murein hydrolase activator NlpD